MKARTPASTPHSLSAAHPSSDANPLTSPATIIRQAYKYIIKFNKAATIIHIDNSLLTSDCWWQLVADIVCIHKLGIMPLLMLNSSTVDNSAIDINRHRRIVSSFNRYQQQVRIVYAQHNHPNALNRNEATTDTSIRCIFTDSDGQRCSVTDLFEQLYRGTIPIILTIADTGFDNTANTHSGDDSDGVDGAGADGAVGGTNGAETTDSNIAHSTTITERNKVSTVSTENNTHTPSHDALLINHSVLVSLCAEHHISKLILLRTHPFFSEQATSTALSTHTAHTDGVSPTEQSEHLAIATVTAQWIAQQPSQWHPALDMIKFAATRDIARMHIIAYNDRQRDSLLEELFSTKGRGFMVYTDRYATIRSPTEQDIPALYTFYQPFVAQNSLRNHNLQRIRTDLYGYYVYELDGEIVAACSCLPLTEQLYELGGLATDPSLHSGGLATQLLHHVCRAIAEQHATDLAYCSVFAITTSAHAWFVQHGFTQIELGLLPQQAVQHIAKRNHRERRVLGTVFHAPLNSIV